MQTMKKFIQYYKPYKGMFFADMACAVVVSAVDISFPQILRGLTNGLFTREPAAILDHLLIVTVLLVLMYLIKMGCEYFIASWGHIMGSKMEGDMRRDLFEKMEQLSFGYYDKNNTGEMGAKMISDLFDICELAHHGPENIFLSILKISGSLVLLGFINVKLTVILACVVVFMIVFSSLLNRRIKTAFTDNRKKIADINVSLQDSLLGIRVVKSFANEKEEAEKFAVSNNAFLESKKASYKIIGKFQAGNGFLQGMLYVVVLCAGGYFIAKGELNPADLAVYALYIGIFISPITLLVNFLETFQKGFAGFERFVQLLEEPVEICDRSEAEPLKHVKGEISYKNVGFSYEKENIVLQNVNLTIRPGQTIAFVGPSGGGKSTLCNLLPRFYDVNTGSVAIDGKDVRNYTQESLRKAIGIVQQDVYLFNCTLKENIAYGKPGASMDEIVQAAKNANIHDYIMSLPQGYETRVGERGVRLSGGQKQRISIARVFLKNPDILILDEATSALDNESERFIQNALERLAENRTTIVIAHRLSTIVNADYIYVIDEGKVKEEGKHQELLRKEGIYARYYKMQFQNPKTASFDLEREL